MLYTKANFAKGLIKPGNGKEFSVQEFRGV